MKVLVVALFVVSALGCTAERQQLTSTDAHNAAAPVAAAQTSSALAAVYSCPMHPEVSQSGPGECPSCGMALVAEQGSGGSGAARACEKCSKHKDGGSCDCSKHGADGGACEKCSKHKDGGSCDCGKHGDHGDAAVYTCPMHPEVNERDPNVRCPKCNMKLEKKK